MNERIRELALQAGIKITPMIVDGVEYEYEDVDMDGSEDLEKFAELIVGECADIALKSGSVPNKSEVAVAEADRIYHKIQEHFGVEE